MKGLNCAIVNLADAETRSCTSITGSNVSLPSVVCRSLTGHRVYFGTISSDRIIAVAPQSTSTMKKKPRKRKPDALAPAQPHSVTGTPLRIPYGNKEVALKLGARYHSGGWYAPPGVDLSAFEERGWL